MDRGMIFNEQCKTCKYDIGVCPSSCIRCKCKQKGLCACTLYPEPDEKSCKFYKPREKEEENNNEV